jgi:hypothetical protein
MDRKKILLISHLLLKSKRPLKCPWLYFYLNNDKKKVKKKVEVLTPPPLHSREGLCLFSFFCVMETIRNDPSLEKSKRPDHGRGNLPALSPASQSLVRRAGASAKAGGRFSNVYVNSMMRLFINPPTGHID